MPEMEVPIFVQIAGMLFSGVWQLFETQWPGTTWTIGGVLLSAAGFGIALSFLSMFFGVGVRPEMRERYRSGRKARAKVSAERKGDEK